jgi:hypothetical protein
VEGSYEHGNEPPGSIKCWEVLEWLHNWQLFKKGSAPWEVNNLNIVKTYEFGVKLTSLKPIISGFGSFVLNLRQLSNIYHAFV